MNCIDLTSNDLKCWDTSQNIQNYAKLRKSSNYNELHRFDVRKIKSTQNYKSDLISMNLDWFDVKTIKTTKVIKLQWIASIWCQKDQTNAKLQKWSNYNELHRFDVRTIKTFELRRKTTKVIKFQWIASIWHQSNQNCWVTSKNIQNYAKLQNDQIIVHCIDLTSKRLNKLRYAAKLQK